MLSSSSSSIFQGKEDLIVGHYKIWIIANSDPSKLFKSPFLYFLKENGLDHILQSFEILQTVVQTKASKASTKHGVSFRRRAGVVDGERSATVCEKRRNERKRTITEK